MNIQTPLVSIIIPTYKRPEKLPRAIQSVLNQTYDNLEIIVVDDNNPETEARKNTEIIMSQYMSNTKVRYIKHECNKNGSAARNTGVRNSTAKYVGFLDDDDEFLPNKIENQVDKLESLPSEYALCYCRYYIDKPGSKMFLSSENREGDLYFDALTRKLVIQAGSNLLIRKDAFDLIGGFDESFKRNQDKEIVTRLLKKYKIAYCESPGLIAHTYLDHSFFDPIEITAHYLAKFQKDIDELSENDRKRFNSEMSRQFFLYHILGNRYNDALKMIFKGKISWYDAIIAVSNKIYKKVFNKV